MADFSLKKNWIENQLWFSMQVTALLLKTAFQLKQIWLQSIQNHARHCFLAAIWTSEVAVLFDLSLKRLPFLRQVFNLDLLLCTGLDLEHADFFLCHTQRPMNNGNIGQTVSSALVGNNILAIPFKISFHMKKKMTCHQSGGWGLEYPHCCPQFWSSKKNSNSTQFIELYFGVSEQIKPL